MLQTDLTAFAAMSARRVNETDAAYAARLTNEGHAIGVLDGVTIRDISEYKRLERESTRTGKPIVYLAPALPARGPYSAPPPDNSEANKAAALAAARAGTR